MFLIQENQIKLVRAIEMKINFLVYFLVDIRCQHCGDTLSTEQDLVLLHTKSCQHMMRPDMHYKFVCYMCSYHTASGQHMEYHLRKHSGEKPFKCPFCRYCSTQNGTLQRHMRIRHSETI